MASSWEDDMLYYPSEEQVELEIWRRGILGYLIIFGTLGLLVALYKLLMGGDVNVNAREAFVLLLIEAFTWPAWYFHAWHSVIATWDWASLDSWAWLAILAWTAVVIAWLGLAIHKLVWCAVTPIELLYPPLIIIIAGFAISLPSLIYLIVVRKLQSLQVFHAGLMAWVGIPFWYLMVALISRAAEGWKGKWICSWEEKVEVSRGRLVRRFEPNVHYVVNPLDEGLGNTGKYVVATVVLVLAAVAVLRHVETLSFKILLAYILLMGALTTAAKAYLGGDRPDSLEAPPERVSQTGGPG